MPVSATGLNASVSSYVSNTTISSSAANTNNQNLNGAVNPTFQTVGVAGVSTFDGTMTLDKTLGGSNQAYIQISPSDGSLWGVDQLSATNSMAWVQGTIQQEIHPTKGTKFRNAGFYLGNLSTFTGTTTGTYNHNMGSTPGIVLPMQDTSGSQTMGFDTPGSSTVHITSGAGAAFTALALAANS